MDDAMLSHNGANGPASETSCMFHPVHQVAAPAAKSAIYNCILFTGCLTR